MQRQRRIQVKYFAILLAIGAVIISIGCATSAGSLPVPEQLMAQGIIGKDADIAALEKGRTLLVTNCASCHRLYWPHEYSPEQWESINRKMGRLASLSRSQIEDIQLYLKTVGRIPPAGAEEVEENR